MWLTLSNAELRSKKNECRELLSVDQTISQNNKYPTSRLNGIVGVWIVWLETNDSARTAWQNVQPHSIQGTDRSKNLYFVAQLGSHIFAMARTLYGTARYGHFSAQLLHLRPHMWNVHYKNIKRWKRWIKMLFAKLFGPFEKTINKTILHVAVWSTVNWNFSTAV